MKTKKSHLLILIAAIATVTLSSFANKSNEGKEKFQDEFIETWNNLKDYTLKVAEALPADKYGYKPNEDIRDFAAQFRHISFTFYFMNGVFIEGKDLEFDPNYNENVALVGGSKSEVKALLSKRFDAVAKAVAGMSKKELNETVVIPFLENKEVTKSELLVWLKNHAAHHVSQSIIYLRMNGITPPGYNGW